MMRLNDPRSTVYNIFTHHALAVLHASHVEGHVSASKYSRNLLNELSKE
jgi:hypothetical protein